MVQSLYTWLGPAIQPFLTELKPVQVKELTESFEALDGSAAGQGTGKQTRWTRVQERERQAAEAAGDSGEAEGEAGKHPTTSSCETSHLTSGEHFTEAEELPDPRLLMDEVDIIPTIPGDFHTAVASSKWKERKEALDLTLEVVKANPRIKDSDGIGELAKALAKRMGDANIQCVMTAAQIIEGLALGIGQSFGRNRAALVPPMLERFKERKQNVVDSIAQALDAVFATVSSWLWRYTDARVTNVLFQVTLPDITEEVLNSLKSKNPQVKEGTAKFFARCLSTTKVPPAKGDLKPIAETLVAMLEDSFEPVRASAADSLGALLKIVGERQLNPFLDPLDDLRKGKVKEASEKATVKCKAGAAPSRPAPPAATPKGAKVFNFNLPFYTCLIPNLSQKPKTAASANDDLMNDVDPTPRAKPPARLLVRPLVRCPCSAADVYSTSQAKKAPALSITEEELKENVEPESPNDFSKPKGKPPARLLVREHRESRVIHAYVFITDKESPWNLGSSCSCTSEKTALGCGSSSCREASTKRNASCGAG